MARIRAGYNGKMIDVTPILSQIEQTGFTAANQLLPLVYDELRKPAAARLTGTRHHVLSVRLKADYSESNGVRQIAI